MWWARGGQDAGTGSSREPSPWSPLANVLSVEALRHGHQRPLLSLEALVPGFLGPTEHIPKESRA